MSQAEPKSRRLGLDERPSPTSEAAPLDPFALHVEDSPPLALLCVLAALAAMGIEQIALPLMTTSLYRGTLASLDQAGDFASNLAAISGIVALGLGLHAFVRHNRLLGAKRRLLLSGLSGVLLAAMTIAVFLERQRTTAETVRFALSASAVLTATLHGVVYRQTRSRFSRALALLAMGMAAAILAAQVCELVSSLTLNPLALRALSIVRGAGETAYLLLLAGAGILATPARTRGRPSLARFLTFFLLPLTLGALYVAELKLGSDYALILYHSQRVSLLVDEMPRLYSVPLALAFAGGLAGLVARSPMTRQMAAGTLMLLGSGFAPQAPGRLLTFMLALTLLARAILYRDTLVAEQVPGEPASVS